MALTGCGSDANTQRGASFGTQICGQNAASAPHYQQPFQPRPGGANTLTGAGSSFAAPLMADWTELYRDAKAAGLVNFLGWVLSDGQNSNGALSYAPLGAGIQRRAVDELRKITVNGTAVLDRTQG